MKPPNNIWTKHDRKRLGMRDLKAARQKGWLDFKSSFGYLH